MIYSNISNVYTLIYPMDKSIVFQYEEENVY